MTQAEASGSCLCGQVRFFVSGPVIAFQYCHCSRCRKASGSAHAANLLVPFDSLQWTAGEDLVQRWDMPEAKYFSRCFCRACGSSLPWASRTGKAFIVPAGSLDEDPGCRPAMSIHWGSKAPWYLAVDELPRHDEGPPRR